MGDKTWQKLSPAERSRTYRYRGGDSVGYQDVTAIAVSGSGTHYVETGDGLKHIVAPGWLSIDLDVDAWTF